MAKRIAPMMRAAGLASLLLSTAVTAVQTAHAETYTVQSERTRHPNIAHALEAMKIARRELDAAPYSAPKRNIEPMK